MSLNRSEQLLFDYVQGHSEEGHYWKSKVQKIASGSAGTAEAASLIEPDLWRYYLERSEVAAPFKAAAKAWGLKRTSMRNLAEHLIRLWTEPKPKAGPDGAPFGERP
ncbi:MAG TPA: hypothetical protein VGG34_06385 [Opitutaceae bacterium]|jgi:hypothetical protein